MSNAAVAGIRRYTVKIEVQQNLPLAHDFERSEKE